MISVIVPVYNARKTLDECVNSILKQTYRDFQIILVNDGSTDDSLKKCNEWAKSDSRIFVIDKRNGGVSSARNAGIKAAGGDMICFVDSDDIVLPSFLEKLHALIEQNDADMSICKMAKQADAQVINGKTTVYSSAELLKALLYGKVTIGVCGIMVKSSVIKENGLFFAEGYRYSEDLHMLWRLAHYCKKVAYTPEKHYVYLDVAGSAMSQFGKDRTDSLVLFDDLYEFFLVNRPHFAKKFKKYGISKNRWSLFWHASIKLPKAEYISLCKGQHYRRHFCNLLTYPSLKVSLSSLVGLFSLSVFRLLALKFAKRYVH